MDELQEGAELSGGVSHAEGGSSEQGKRLPQQKV